jgi:hypothetical protein
MYEQLSKCGSQFRTGWEVNKELWFIEQLKNGEYVTIGYEPDHTSAIERLNLLCQEN